MAIIYDVICVLLLIFFTLRGKRRGLIKTIAGILIVILAFWGAGTLARETSPIISEKFVSPAIADFLTPKIADSDTPGEIETQLIKIGVPAKLAESIVSVSPVNELFLNATKTLSEKITYALLYLIYFLLLLLILKLVVKLVDRIFDFPVLNFVNGLGGALCGAILGYLLILLLAIILLNTGFIVDRDVVTKTYILRFMLDFNPFHL